MIWPSPVTVTTNGQINGSTELNHLLGADVYNHGKIHWNAPKLTSYGSWLQNLPGGLLDFQGDTLFDTFGAADRGNVVINDGTLLKSAGTGVLDFTGPDNFTNNATLSIQAGTLKLYKTVAHNGTLTVDAAAGVEFLGGSTTLGGSHKLSGAGFYGVPAGGSLSLYGNLQATNFQMNGTLMGDCLLNGKIDVHSGSLQGTLTLASNGVINLTGCTQCGSVFATTTFFGQIANAGTINWINGDLICLASSLTNQKSGVFNILCDNPLTGFNGFGTWSNAGVIRKSGSTGTNDLSGIRLDNHALVEVKAGGLILPEGLTSSGTENTAAGATLLLTGGTVDLQDGHLFTGAGYYGVPAGGSIELFGTIFATNFQMHGTLRGTNELAGIMFSYSGHFAGATTVAAGGLLNLDGCANCGSVDASIRLSGTLTNAGTVNWRSGDWSAVGGTLVNLEGCLVDMQGDLRLTPFGLDTWMNRGRFRKSAGAGVATLDGVIFNNFGGIEVYRGVLQFKDNYHPSYGSLNLFIEGPGQNGRIRFTTTAPLMESIGAVVPNNYIPSLGDTWTLIEYPNATGTFPGHSTPFPPPPGALWNITRTATAILASIIPDAPLPQFTVTGTLPGPLDLQWPTDQAVGFHLSYATNLIQPVIWYDVTNQVESANGQSTIHFTPDRDVPEMYFQLH